MFSTPKAYQKLRDIMAKVCCLRVRVNSLWQWVYCLLVVMAEGYLMYRAVTACREYNELPWRTEHKPVAELYAYITFIVISIMCVPFFVIVAMFKVGNYSSDGVRLGRDDVTPPRIPPMGDGENQEEREPSYSKILWKHSGPLSTGFHLMAAFSLLLPRVLMDAQKIKYGFLQPSAIWNSELDVLVAGEGTVAVVTSSAGLTYNQSTFVVQPQGTLTTVNQWEVVSPEFINYVIAAIIFSVRYPSVFWYTKMAFSLIFCFQLLVSTAFYMLAFCNMAVLYKFQVNAAWRPDIQLALPSGIIIWLYLMSCIFVYFPSIAIFNYGFYHYDEAKRKYLKSQGRLRNKPARAPTGCDGYIPHTVATIALVLFVSARAPLVYDGVTIYRKTGNTICLASIVWDVCYMFVWIITWFCFTIKQHWEFKIRAIAAPAQRAEVYMIRNDLSQEPVVTVNGAVGDTSHEHSDRVMDDVSAEPCREHPVEPPPLIPPHSPTSALRKGERKPNNARVTFESEDFSLDSAGVSQEPLIEDRDHPRRRSKQSTPNRKRKRKEDKMMNNEAFEMDEPIPAPTRTQSARATGQEDNLDGLSFTPDNTLVRNYRHSIRDKCGQYYRRSREFSSPPAAQSSPVLPPRRRSEKIPREPPALPRNAQVIEDNQIAERHPSPVILLQDDDRRSQSPARPPTVERSSLQIHPTPQPRKPVSGDINRNTKTNLEHHNGRSSARDLSRELKIINKPEIGRRDSALPSSNETSSNESGENVLCSQV